MDFIEAERFAFTHHCATCGNLLSLYPKEEGGYEVHCPRPGHSGFAKETSWTEGWKRGEAIPLSIANKIEKKERRKMEEEFGKEKSQQLAQYIGVTTLSQQQAMEILKTIWPKAPDLEVLKAAALCHIYALNPLMKHIFLVPFTDKKTGIKEWETILALRATRLIASRNHHYSYLEGPRIMLAKEQEKIFGEADEKNIWVITTLQDENGNQAPGYGSWNKNEEPRGTNKGNTKFNMAATRSERQAFERLFPGDIPQGVEIADEKFIEGEYQEASAADSPATKHPAQNHDAKKPLPTPGDIRNLGQLFEAAQKHFAMSQAEVLKELGISKKESIADAGDAWAQIVEVRKNE